MSYAEFQQRYEIEGERDRARYDRQPVARLLEAVRRGQFGGQYQLWYSIGARASLGVDAGYEPVYIGPLDPGARLLEDSSALTRALAAQIGPFFYRYGRPGHL